MTERKFTPPTEFPAEYMGGGGLKVVIYGRGIGGWPLVGQDAKGRGIVCTDKGRYLLHGISYYDLHDIPKRVTTWHNVYRGANVAVGCGSRQGADRSAVRSRACVYRIERDEDGCNPEIFVEDV
jgi:hypothetical protein